MKSNSQFSKDHVDKMEISSSPPIVSPPIVKSPFFNQPSSYQPSTDARSPDIKETRDKNPFLEIKPSFVIPNVEIKKSSVMSAFLDAIDSEAVVVKKTPVKKSPVMSAFLDAIKADKKQLIQDLQLIGC